ncbi:hypothetical protein GTP23_16880 [Pseudoduganella sp. FT93W]|uniref:Uncharacterized protein n=1 Tax=Duganella fentianensis TaxID=2692177 RepID=A0A845I0R7_9BURK|nr:hypothetical protein [Duganella fentianensis]MYN46722.1 hypothetical protein [Duganella fentianensis]
MAFPNSLHNIAKKASKQDATNFVHAFLEVVKARERYLQHRETEITKRVHIRANAEIEISNIREKAQLLRDYFVMTFAERRENFDRCFQLLDAGMSSQNNQQIDAALALIVKMIDESPLKQANEVMQQLKHRSADQIIDI